MSAHKFVAYSRGNAAPPNAVEGGYDCDGSKMYIGKTQHQNDEMPCKIVPKRRLANFSYKGKEHGLRNCEILVQSKLHWQHCDGISIPGNAVPGGRTSSGEILYIGRAGHEGSLSMGKVHPSHHCLYIPFGGSEVSIKSFEILVII